jgi:tRNA(Ile)-lysidine synthetase-like protein
MAQSTVHFQISYISYISYTMSSDISEFWRAHPKYWIALGATQARADADIYARFSEARLETYAWVDQVIYLDQFMRHFQRAAPDKVTEDMVGLARTQATSIVLSNKSALGGLDEFELVFSLMPFKHIGDYDFLFTAIHEYWLPAQTEVTLRAFPLLLKFYTDSYVKHYSCARRMYRDVHLYYDDGAAAAYDPVRICDAYPAAYAAAATDAAAWATQALPDCAGPLVAALKAHAPPSRPIIVSLSGGVDSMVMCYLLKRAGIPVVAAHIVYGNRDISEEEFAFVRAYCVRLEVPLYVYHIEWLRRDLVEREFYEEMTRKLRFMVYHSVGGGSDDEPPHVLMGHIQDDLVENVWTNLAHATHLTDLTKMAPHEVMEGVNIHRPWLNVKKAAVYAVSTALSIPYLKNTTPSWSNRGKFRETFHAATLAQYGPSVDDKVLESARALAAQAALIDRLLYTPIYDSWNADARTLDVTRAVEAALDGVGWSRIFTTVCHTKLGVSKPSIHACGDFCTRLEKAATGSRITLKKNLTVVVHRRPADATATPATLLAFVVA